VYCHSSLAVRRIFLLQFETIKQYFHISTFRLLSSTEFYLAKGKLSPLWRARAYMCVCGRGGGEGGRGGLKWVCCRLRHVPSLIIYVALLCLGDILMGCIYIFS